MARKQEAEEKPVVAEDSATSEKLRQIDSELIRLLSERKKAIANIPEAGYQIGEEEALLSQIINLGKKYDLDAYFVNKIFKDIQDYFKRLHQDRLADYHRQATVADDQIVVAFQGIEGAYSHLVGQKFFASRLDRVVFKGLLTFRAILEAVEKGGADYAILPIENTTAGSINESYDLLAQTKLSIIGEEILPVDHCLMAIENVPLSRIRRIYSHPQALAQCSTFLSSLDHCTVESFVDTAMAIKKVKDDQDLSEAAIGSEEAAQLYGLTVVKRDIANTRENYTRFFIVAREPVKYDERIPCKTSLIIATKHVEGALVNCLNVLAKHHLNLTKLESRPRANVPWEYLFYVDFEGNLEQPNVKIGLEELTGEVSFMKVLGSYPAKTNGIRRQADTEIAARNTTPISDTEPPPERPKGKIAIPEKKPYRLAGRFTKAEDTRLKVKNVVIGGGTFVVMAGPCAVESDEQINLCARAVAENGGDILRGGVFKPRTSPYSFQGLGFEGLELMAHAGERYGLPIITEVLHPTDAEKIAKRADILQIGARNMQNFPLLREVGRLNKPILLKRGMMASIDELLAAAEYILSQGNQQVILCERGIRTFETATRNTLDLSAVPVLKYHSHLPVIVDPSHASGDWKWIIPLVEASLAVGADGVIVEIHPEPEKAMSDGEQSLNFKNFEVMMKRLQRLKNLLK
ncbi:3-deoxy-7-phosphoheptulonate synthase [candidate division KSB1 bacterium]|nr:3-deoxy-7-phosphoheptulonate synthase [candidate division KSB1 bacterium]